ncbi:MAG: HIRAN domain-containing protein [Erysipelotrichaceae bacterium]|nr:HIRAN domain-containing protein [Erysipelotrichaceae bacterium]
MALFDKLKEQIVYNQKKAVPISPLNGYVEVLFWDTQYDEIGALFDDLELNGIHSKRIYLKAKIEPEPDNQADKNAVKVLAGKKGRGTPYHFIGYIPSEQTAKIKECDVLTHSGAYFWSVTLDYNRFEGSSFRLSMREVPKKEK